MAGVSEESDRGTPLKFPSFQLSDTSRPGCLQSAGLPLIGCEYICKAGAACWHATPCAECGTKRDVVGSACVTYLLRDCSKCVYIREQEKRREAAVREPLLCMLQLLIDQ
jgi:hypothetical protein